MQWSFWSMSHDIDIHLRRWYVLSNLRLCNTTACSDVIADYFLPSCTILMQFSIALLAGYFHQIDITILIVKCKDRRFTYGLYILQRLCQSLSVYQYDPAETRWIHWIAPSDAAESVCYVFKQTVCRFYKDSQWYSAELMPIEKVGPCDKPRLVCRVDLVNPFWIKNNPAERRGQRFPSGANLSTSIPNLLLSNENTVLSPKILHQLILTQECDRADTVKTHSKSTIVDSVHCTM